MMILQVAPVKAELSSFASNTTLLVIQTELSTDITLTFTIASTFIEFPRYSIFILIWFLVQDGSF